MSPDSSRVDFVREAVDRETIGLLAYDGDTLVGVAEALFPLLDNPSLAYASLLVGPNTRRRGAGSALLSALEAAMAERGRTVLQTEIPMPLGADPATVPGVAFASRRGFTKAHAETHFVLELPPPAGRLDELAAHAAERVGAYRLVSWIDRCPDEWVDAVCRLEEAFVDEAPSGDLEIESERWSEERLRDGEARRRARGQHVFFTAAVAPDGVLVGNTELVLGEGMVRGGAMQSGTLVLPEHRGHRLGLAVKVANLRQLLAFDDAQRLLHTYNAGVNAPMLAVNAQLGFKAVEVEEEWQLKLS